MSRPSVTLLRVGVIDRELQLPGLRMHVREWDGEGPPVLLVHGLASNARIWDLTARLVAAAGARVVAVDQRGHGLTEKPSDGYDFPTIVTDLQAAADALRLERPVIVGHSWGASVAANYALTYPESVSGIVLLDGGVFDLSASMSWEEAEQRMAPPDLTQLTREDFLDRARTWGKRLSWDEATIDAVMGNFYVADDGMLRPHLSRENHMRILHAMYHQPPADVLQHVQCPVLLAPTFDSAMGEEFLGRKRGAVERALGVLPHGDVHWFEDSIHDVQLQRPADVAQVIVAFAARVSAGASAIT